ncbi:MAG: glutaredoxin domain-containing protein [Proteobacteria bacterium]|nr:glutaredoxin domain-containing protein [Pseudomonadota bacterium]
MEIYFKSWCPYSRRALALLSDNGVPFTVIDVTSDRVLEAEMIDRSGRTSVPQIFIDGEKIGGYDDLKAIVASGAFARRLDIDAAALLAA